MLQKQIPSDPGIIVFIDQIEILGSFHESIFVEGDIKTQDSSRSCILVFSAYEFERALNQSKDEEAAIQVTRAEKYSPPKDKLSFMCNLPLLEAYKAVEFQVVNVLK